MILTWCRLHILRLHILELHVYWRSTKSFSFSLASSFSAYVGATHVLEICQKFFLLPSKFFLHLNHLTNLPCVSFCIKLGLSLQSLVSLTFFNFKNISSPIQHDSFSLVGCSFGLTTSPCRIF